MMNKVQATVTAVIVVCCSLWVGAVVDSPFEPDPPGTDVEDDPLELAVAMEYCDNRRRMHSGDLLAFDAKRGCFEVVTPELAEIKKLRARVERLEDYHNESLFHPTKKWNVNLEDSL